MPPDAADPSLMSTIMEGLPVGVWVARAPTGEFMYANTTFMEIMGQAGRTDVAAGEYAEPYGIHGLDGEPYPEARMPFVQALEKGCQVMIDDIVIHHPDGQKVNIRAWAKPVYVDDRIDHVVVAFVDITPEVEAQAAQANSEAHLIRAQRMQSIGNLAGGIAHDFNNVLGAVRTIASTLALREANAERRAALEAIDVATARAHELTRSLLEFAGRETTQTRPVDVDVIVSTVTNLFARATDARITVELELGDPSRVLGDAARLEQVVMNLVVNALDAQPDGGTVTVRTSDHDTEVWIEVMDAGPGIPIERRERVFEPYFTTREDGRGGLGLATVYGVVQSHGGSVEVVDADVGSHFRVRLPVGDVSSSPDEDVLGADAATGRLQVLLVDDDDMVRSAAAMALEVLGHEVVSVESGRRAVGLYQADGETFDLVILDLAMPEFDGRKTFAALREIDPGVRVLLASGYALSDEAETLLSKGIAGFLQKPYGIGDLSVAIAAALEDRGAFPRA